MLYARHLALPPSTALLGLFALGLNIFMGLVVCGFYDFVMKFVRCKFDGHKYQLPDHFFSVYKYIFQTSKPTHGHNALDTCMG